MEHLEPREGMIVRLFRARAKKGCTADLLRKFATRSADVVQNEPGNKGYFFGQQLSTEEDVLVFASLWTDLSAVKSRFGEDWQRSFLPDGYEDLIEDCSVEHISVRTWGRRSGRRN